MNRAITHNWGLAMGSTGTGSFTDYPGSSGKKDGKDGGTGSSGGQGGGQSDKCGKAFSVTLEDVAHYSFYQKHKTTPSVGTKLKIIQKKRILAQDMSTEEIGALPASHNYLAGCLKSGYSYSGSVTQSRVSGTSLVVTVDFAPI